MPTLAPGKVTVMNEQPWAAGRVLRRVLVASSCLLTPACLLLGDGFTYVRGAVRDTEGVPIVDARVTLRGDDDHGFREEALTDGLGAFSVGGTHAPARFWLTLTISKDGYRTDTRRLRSSDDYVVEIVLQRGT